MAEWIHSGEVTPEELREKVDFSKFYDDQMDALRFAMTLGCDVMISSAELITLVPHKDSPMAGGKRIHMSARKRVPLSRMLKQIRRMGDPVRVERLDSLATDLMDGDINAKIKALSEWESLGPAEEIETGIMLPDYEKPKERHVKETPPPAPVAVVTPKAKERHIISERPALMHRNITSKGGQSYPSKTTLERRWSDGKIEYVCAVPTCGKTSDNRLAFRGPHYAMHVRKNEAPPLDGEEQKNVVDDPTYTEPAYTKAPTTRRRDGLVSVLKGIDLTAITPEDLADQIEAYLAALNPGGGAGTGEPLTAEQIIDRIRRLVDTGKYIEQEQVIEAQSAQIAELTDLFDQQGKEFADELLAAQQRATKAEAQWQALRDLINEAATDE